MQVLEKIKGINSRAACIMVTRITDQAKVDRARELGASRYLLKPIDTKDLIAVVNKVVQEFKEQS